MLWYPTHKDPGLQFCQLTGKQHCQATTRKLMGHSWHSFTFSSPCGPLLPPFWFKCHTRYSMQHPPCCCELKVLKCCMQESACSLMLPYPPSHVPQCQLWPSTSTCDRVGHPSAQYMPEETQHDNAHYSSPSSWAQIAQYLMQPLLTLMDLNTAHHRFSSWFRPLENQNQTILNQTNGLVQGSPNFENQTKLNLTIPSACSMPLQSLRCTFHMKASAWAKPSQSQAVYNGFGLA
jgi:hypothetical protein